MLSRTHHEKNCRNEYWKFPIVTHIYQIFDQNFLCAVGLYEPIHRSATAPDVNGNGCGVGITIPIDILSADFLLGYLLGLSVKGQEVRDAVAMY